MAERLFENVMAHLLQDGGHADNVASARKLLQERRQPAFDEALASALGSRPFLVLGPAHDHAVLQPVLNEGECLRLPVEDGRALNLTYAGDFLTVHMPLTERAVKELRQPGPGLSVASTLATLGPAVLVAAALERSALPLSPLDQLALGVSPTLDGQLVAPVVPITPVTRPTPQSPDGIDVAVWAKPVADLDLSIRARKALSRLGITPLGELTGCTEEQLLQQRNMGLTTVNEIRQKLAGFGLRLDGE
jgi:hypothetical protein